MATNEDNKRLYHLRHKKTGAEFLVNAGTKASARNHLAIDDYTAEVAKPKEVARLVASGVKVLQAGAESRDEAES